MSDFAKDWALKWLEGFTMSYLFGRTPLEEVLLLGESGTPVCTVLFLPRHTSNFSSHVFTISNSWLTKP
jgi:hypothetical protein